MEEDLAPSTVETAKTEPAESTTPTTTPAAAVPAVPSAPITKAQDSATTVIGSHTLKNSFSFPIGTAVVKERLDIPAYRSVLIREFNSVTVESTMNFKSLHPEADKWDFAKSDAIVAFAQQNNMRVHGQTLLYPKDSMMPKWIMNYSGDKAAWEKLLKTHISTVVAHYKGKVKAWDVINESINDNGTLRDNIWLRKIGSDYIELAFKYAQEADPSAVLFLNDYGQEYGGKKMTKILDIVAQAKKKNIIIGGLGFQMHTIVGVDVNGVINNLKKAAAIGVQVYLSELDISVRSGKGDTFVLDNELALRQGEKFKAIVKAYMNTVPKSQQYGITTWGVSDRNSFWNVNYANYDHDYPLLFDKDYNPKPAYTGFLEAGLGK